MCVCDQIDVYIYNFGVEILQHSFFSVCNSAALYDWGEGKAWFSERGVESAKVDGGEFGQPVSVGQLVWNREEYKITRLLQIYACQNKTGKLFVILKTLSLQT